jgi:hypothetical protein
MTFGRRSLFRPANRAVSGPGFRGLAAAFFLLILAVIAGCGGGSSNSLSNTGGGNNTRATVTGRVVDQYSSRQPITGAIVTLGSTQTTTDNAGNFTISVTNTASAGSLRVTGPGGSGLYDLAVIGGTQYNIRSTGFPVPALANNQNLALGDVLVYSESGPPPPPSL